jgi:hypothetical protein
MTARVQTLRSSIAGARPLAGTRQPGELYVNWPDGMLGVIDAAQNPQDLIPVRFFSPLASYVIGDFVVYNGQLLFALVPVAPGVFNPAQWSPLATTSATDALYLSLTGGTLTGPLTVPTLILPGGTPGQFLTYNAAGAQWTTLPAGTTVTVSDTPPVGPLQGDMWFDSVSGQMFVWYFDGNSSQWVIVVNSTASMQGYLPLTGGVVIGTLSVQGPNNFALIAPAGNQRAIIGATGVAPVTGAAMRWQMLLGDTTAETGVNAGSNFALNALSDTGAALSTPIAINRATGAVTLTGLLTGTNATFSSDVSAANVSAPQAMGDNRIINGDMRIDQRNGGAPGVTVGYTVDRWQYVASQANIGNWGQESSASAVGFGAYLGFTSTSAYASVAADYFEIFQPIEADMVSDFAWGTANAQPVTLSFWASASVAGTYSGTIQNYAGTRTYPFSYSIPAANTWTKIVIFIPGDTGGAWVMSGNAGSMYVAFDLGSGSSRRGPAGAWASASYIGVTGSVSVVATNGAGFAVTGVKLEIGSVATPFNRQSMAKSLADCQRYCQTIAVSSRFPASAGAQTSNSSVSWQTMRALPTSLINVAGTNVNLTTADLIVQTANSARYEIISAAAGDAYSINVGYLLDAEL